MIKDLARWIALGGVFLLPFLPLLVSDSLFFPFITGKNFAFRIIVEIVVAAWVVLALYDKEYRVRFSYVLASFAAFLSVMFFANLFGESPHKSFWSNYERMDGYVTLVHLGLYLLVAGSVLRTERLWNAFWNISLVVAVFMTLYGFCQLSGSESCKISQSDFRIDGRMGNAAYLAVYMLFHFFISLVLLVRSKSNLYRTGYGVLALSFVFILYETVTRGTLAALMGGVFISAVYIAVFERENKTVRRIAVAGVVAVMVIVSSFFFIRNSEFVQGSKSLSRIASVFSLKELTTRTTIWSLAVEGIKEHPILGWGQENFNYVFNQHYKASLYAQEPWFDRVHNLVLDWLIAGGLFGFLAYASILASALYYIVIRPRRINDAMNFSVMEQGLLFGLLSAYIAHNLLVFDNLISYFFFASVLAMIHARFATDIKQIAVIKVSPDVIRNIAVPVVAVVLVCVVYVVNVPSIRAAMLLIQTFQAPNDFERLETFKAALGRGSFANQEIREQFVQATQTVLMSPKVFSEIQQLYPNLSPEDLEKRVQDLKGQYVVLAESELQKQLNETPDDVRILVFQSSFLRTIGKTDEAITQLRKAVALSPQKQQVLFELGLAQIQAGDVAGSQETFKHAFELDDRNDQARMFYAASAIYAKDKELEDTLVTKEYESSYVASDVIVRALYDTKRYDDLISVLQERIVKNPNDRDKRVSLAAVQNEAGEKADAIKTLEKAIKDFPAFKAEGERYIQQIKQK